MGIFPTMPNALRRIHQEMCDFSRAEERREDVERVLGLGPKGEINVGVTGTVYAGKTSFLQLISSILGGSDINSRVQQHEPESAYHHGLLEEDYFLIDKSHDDRVGTRRSATLGSEYVNAYALRQRGRKLDGIRIEVSSHGGHTQADELDRDKFAPQSLARFLDYRTLREVALAGDLHDLMSQGLASNEESFETVVRSLIDKLSVRTQPNIPEVNVVSKVPYGENPKNVMEVVRRGLQRILSFAEQNRMNLGLNYSDRVGYSDYVWIPEADSIIAGIDKNPPVFIHDDYKRTESIDVLHRLVQLATGSNLDELKLVDASVKPNSLLGPKVVRFNDLIA